MPPLEPTSAERSAKAGGKAYWRSLAELAETPEFKAFLEKEFSAGVEMSGFPASLASTSS